MTPEYQDLNKKLDRLLFIIDNDEKTNRKGLVEDVANMKATLEDLVFKQKMFVAKVAFIGAVGGFLFTVLVWISDKVSFK